MNPRLFILENSLFSETILPQNETKHSNFFPNSTVSQLSSTTSTSKDSTSEINFRKGGKIDDKMSVFTPRNTSASEALELYLNSHFSSAPVARNTKTPTEHSRSASWIQCQQNYTTENSKEANYGYSTAKILERSEDISGLRNPTSARTNVSSFTANDMAQTSTPRGSNSHYASNISPLATVVGAYSNPNAHSSRSQQISQALPNRSSDSEHAMSSSASQLLSTLDKLRDKLKQPQTSVQNPLANYQSLPPTFAYLMSEQPQSVYQTTANDAKVFNRQNGLSAHSNLSNSQGSRAVNNVFQKSDPRFFTASGNPRLDNVSKSKGGFSPMDFAKLAEEPISAAGLAIRPRIERPPKLTQNGNRKTSRSFEVSDKLKKGGNLRRSRSLNAASKRSVEKEVITAPENVNWETNLDPDLVENNAIVTPRNEAGVRTESNRGALKTGQDQLSYLFTTTHKTVPSQQQDFADVSIASLNCSTCVPKPLKRRSASLDRALPKNQVATTAPPNINKPISHPIQGRKLTNVYKGVNFKSSTSLAKNSIHQKGKPPKLAGVVNIPPLNYDETANIMKEFPSFKPLPNDFGSQSCQDLFVSSSASKELESKQESHKQHFSSHSKSNSNLTREPEPLLYKESYNANQVLNSNSGFVAVASEPKFETFRNKKLEVCKEPAVDQNFDQNARSEQVKAIVMTDVQNDIVPMLSLPMEKKTSVKQLPSNESYVSAFEHVPLRCSTPRSLIPSSRPLSDSSQGVTTSNERRPVTSLQPNTSSQKQFPSSKAPISSSQQQITSSQSPVLSTHHQITSSQLNAATSSQLRMKHSQPSLGMSDFESYKLLAMSGGDNWKDINFPSPLAGSF